MKEKKALTFVLLVSHLIIFLKINVYAIKNIQKSSRTLVIHSLYIIAFVTVCSSTCRGHNADAETHTHSLFKRKPTS